MSPAPLPRSGCISNVSLKETRHIETLIATIIGAAVIFSPAPTKELQYSRVHADEIPYSALELAPLPETIEQKADRIADEYEVPRETLRNLVYYESRWNPDAIGDHGCSFGLVQINLCVHKNVTKEQAFDPDFSLKYAAREISEGREYAWSVCSCFSLVRTKQPLLPRQKDLAPNWNRPIVGAVAIFDYDGVPHVAYVTDIFDGYFYIFEANYSPCKVGTRRVEVGDKHLVGFWVAG